MLCSHRSPRRRNLKLPHWRWSSQRRKQQMPRWQLSQRTLCSHRSPRRWNLKLLRLQRN